MPMRPVSEVALRIGLALVLFVLCVQIIGFSAAMANTPLFSCTEVRVDVSAATPAEQRLICAGASKAIKLLARCGVQLHRRVDIIVVGSGDVQFDGHVYAYFDQQEKIIRLVRVADLSRIIPPDSHYVVLTLDELYESIAVHEVSHAVFHQNLQKYRVPLTAHEYVAFAIQIQGMNPDARARLLQFEPRRWARDLSQFSEVLLMMARNHFAALAYDHFMQPGNGCNILQGIIAGKVQFPEYSEE